MSLSFVAHKKDCEDVIANKQKYPQANRFYLIYTHSQGVPDMVKEFKRLHLLIFLQVNIPLLSLFLCVFLCCSGILFVKCAIPFPSCTSRARFCRFVLGGKQVIIEAFPIDRMWQG